MLAQIFLRLVCKSGEAPKRWILVLIITIAAICAHSGLADFELATTRSQFEQYTSQFTLEVLADQPRSILGPILQFGAVVSVVVDTWLIYRLSKIESMDAWDIVSYYAPFAFFSTLLTALFYEGGQFLRLPDVSVASLLLNILSGAINIVLIVFTIQALSVQGFIVANSLKQGMLNLLANVLYVRRANTFELSFLAVAAVASCQFLSPLHADNSVTNIALTRRTSDDPSQIDASYDEEEEGAARKDSHPVPETQILAQKSLSLGLVFSMLCCAFIGIIALISIAAQIERPILPSYNNRKLAAIIEPRDLPHFEPLLVSYITTLPPSWPVVAFVSAENYQVLAGSSVLKRFTRTQRLTLRMLPDIDIGTGEMLSRFLTVPWFWNQLDAEWILFFQSDSIACSKSDQNLDDWIGYDWVGAPWLIPEPDEANNGSIVEKGGNGGVSLRKRSSILTVINTFDRIDDDWPEDTWFIARLKELEERKILDVKWPTHQARFSVEHVAEPEGRPLFFHVGGRPTGSWLEMDTVKARFDYCSELKLLDFSYLWPYGQ